MMASRLKGTQPSFPAVSSIEEQALVVVEMAKMWQLSVLPYKYFFDSSYNALIA